MKKALWISSLLAIVLIAGLVFYVQSSNTVTGNVVAGTTGSVSSEQGNALPTASEKVITLDASRFQYSPGTITVKKGDHVKIMIDNKDTTHGIAIPDFGVSGVDSVEFTADKAGTFQFRCPTMCGSGHRTMTGTLIVEE